MSDIDGSPSLPQPQPLPLKRLLWIAVALPLFVASVDYFLLFWAGPIRSPNYQYSIRPEVCIQFTWYVLQVAVVSYVVGRGIRHSILRWIVFGWIMSLVTLLSAIGAMTPYPDPHTLMPAASLFVGEIGLCMVWAFSEIPVGKRVGR